MAITWGSKKNGVRIGVEVDSMPSVSSGTSSVAVDVDVWIDRDVNIADSSNTLSWSGGVVTDGSSSNIDVGGSGSKKIKTLSGQSQTLDYGSTKTATVSVVFEGINYAGGDLSVSKTVTYPARPYSIPAAPSGCTVTRVSDTQHTVQWTNNAVSPGAPYSNVYVERQDLATATWTQIATVAGSATSYSDASTKVDSKYQYRVRAKNTAGYSSYSTGSAYVYTTPAAPTSLVATKSGTQISLAWTNNARYDDGIEVWHAANGVWDAAALATVAPTSASYTHSGAVVTSTHQYRIRAKVGSLFSAYATSGVVQLLAPPNAPQVTLDLPIFDASLQSQVARWVHQPVDATAQTAAQVDWRPNNLAAWTTIQITGSGKLYTWPPGFFANGSKPEVRVRTKGEHASYGPYSAIIAMVTSAMPQATITSPADGGSLNTSALTVAWDYFDAEATVESGWEVVLYTAAGVVLHDNSDTDPATSYLAPVALTNNTSYQVGVRVRDGSGLWSDETRVSFSTLFAMPPAPVGSGDWVPDQGAVMLQIQVPSPGATEVPATTLTVERWDPGRQRWAVVQEKVSVGDQTEVALLDPIPPLYTDLQYRATVWSDTNTTQSSEFSVGPSSDSTRCWIYLNGGPDWDISARIRVNAQLSIQPVVEKVLRYYDGRAGAVEYQNQTRSTQIQVRGSTSGNGERIQDRGDWHDWDIIAAVPAPICYRDHLGQRIFASVTVGGIDHDLSPLAAVSATVTEVDYVE